MERPRMPNTLFDALFAPHTDRDSPFLRLAGGAAVSYAGFLETAAGFAHVLDDAGLVPGDRVAVQVEKSPGALALYAACVQAGLVFLPLNPGYTAEELGYFIDDSGAGLLVCDPGRARALAPLAETRSAALLTLGAAGDGTLAEAWRFTAEDVLLHALPIFHTHGLFVASNVSLATGCSMIFLPGFDLDAVIGHMPEATAMMGVPTFYTRLLGDRRLTRELTAHMRLFVSGSAPLLPDTHEKFAARTGHRILERYGMTETGMNTSNPHDGERRAGTVGPPLPGVEVRVTDPATGRTLAPGDIGQVEVRGPNVFKGYWKMPEKTATEFREDGFFITGDLGAFDADGYLRIVGRDKDLIISGGYNIYPKEIELVLDARPGVLESAVIGVPHEDFGETPVALVVAERDSPPDREAITAELRTTLARYKHPRALLFIDELPRNAMGKVQKNVLRDSYRNLFSGS